MKELTQNQITQVEQFFDNLKGNIPIKNLNQWDGFLTGWVCISENKGRSDLIPTMLGEWEKDDLSSADFSNFESNCKIQMESLTQVFEDPKYNFSPTFMEQPENNLEEIVDWCQGFIYAINLYKKYPEQLSDRCLEYWEDINGVVKGKPNVENLPDHEDYVPEIIGGVSFCVDQLYVAWNSPYQNKKTHFINTDSNEFKKSPHGIVEKYLKKYASENALFNGAALDGYMTAIASSPEMIMPSEWLPEIWGGDEFSPEWESKKEFGVFFENVQSIYNTNIDFLRNTPDEFEPLFFEGDNEKLKLVGALPWCNGYLKGIGLREEQWRDLPGDLQPILGCIVLVGSGELINKSGESTISPNEVQDILDEIIAGIPQLFIYWHNQMLDFVNPKSKEPIIRQEKKVGRNDPCICGSGKKFKKCCGM